MRKPTVKSLTKKCDKAWAELVKKNGRCVRCGTDQNLQAAHIITRSNRTTRWDPRNGICFCAGHHLFWAHKEPLEFADFIRRTRPKDYDYLLYRKNQYTKWTVPDLEILLLDLKKKLVVTT